MYYPPALLVREGTDEFFNYCLTEAPRDRVQQRRCSLLHRAVIDERHDAPREVGTCIERRREMRVRYALIILAAVGLVGVGVALGSIPDGSGVIHGCYKPGGQLRVIDTADGQDCKSGESGLNWNQTGTTGPPGPALQTQIVTQNHDAIFAEGSSLDGQILGGFLGDARVFCPDGTTIVSGGGTIGPAGFYLMKTEPFKNSTNSGWHVVYAADTQRRQDIISNGPLTQQITALALCADA